VDQVKVVDSIKGHPLHDIVLVKVIDEELEATRGGIIVPQGALLNKKTMTGEVVAVGPGRISESGEKIPMQSEIGMRVIIPIATGYPVVLGDQGEHIILKDRDIFLRIDEEWHWATDEELKEMPSKSNLIL